MSKAPILTARTQDAFIDRCNVNRAFELKRQELVRRDMAANARAKLITTIASAATFVAVFCAAVAVF